MPAWARDEAEAVARGFCRADAPARRRRARFQRWRRAQQKKRQARIGGGEMQPLAQFQIELVDGARDGGRRLRTQRLLDRPQGLFAMRGFDQDQAARIETERAQAMTMKPAMRTAAIGRHYQDEGVSPRALFPPPQGGRRKIAAENRRDEAEGGRDAAFGLGHDFMQGAAGEAALRQMGIKRGKAERQGFPQTFHPGQQPAQFIDHGGAIARGGTCSNLNHLAVPWRCISV
jgi:hypothetical protein